MCLFKKKKNCWLNLLHSDILTDANLKLLAKPTPAQLACFIRWDTVRAAVPTLSWL